MVLEKFPLKNSKFYEEYMANQLFCHPAISQFSLADISFNIKKSWKLLKLALLILGFSSFIRPRLIWVKLYANYLNVNSRRLAKIRF